MKQQGDQLLAHILTGGNDTAANELLNEFLDGYPIEKLRLLLQSDVETACEAGAFIVSELGEKAAPLVNDLDQWLDHPLRNVRFDILDAILVAVTSQHGEIIAKAVRLIRDPDEAVRWKTLHLLSKGSKDQLASAIPYLDSKTDAKLLIWMLGSDGVPIDRQEVITRLADPDLSTRMFAAAGAARLGLHDRVPLNQAAASTDQEISLFAKQELDMLNLKLTQRRRRKDSQ